MTEIFANAVQNMCKGEVNQYFNRFKKTDLESYIEKLIKATDYEKCVKTDFDQQLIQDLDLNTLGSTNTEYNKYANQIRLEYKQFSDAVFYQERIKILNTFLNRKYIFNIKYFRDKYEYIARDNITKEISNLKK